MNIKRDLTLFWVLSCFMTGINSSGQCVSLEGRLKVTRGGLDPAESKQSSVILTFSFLPRQPGVDHDG